MLSFKNEIYSKDLHRKGQLKKVDQMEKLGKKLIKNKDMGLAFFTEGYQGFDCFGVIANKPEFTKNEGYILFNEQLNKPQFISDNED